MMLTIAQDKLLRKYTMQIDDEHFKLKTKNLPQEIKNELIEIDESNMVLYGEHLIINIKEIEGR